ncbi:MAG: FecR family protein [Bacteroidetes bacterium]|nr:FecR family protein [Fibrella sp.]
MERLPFPPNLLDKYRDGTASPDERQRVEAWYASLPGDVDYLASRSPAERRFLQDQTFQAIRAKSGLPTADPAIIPFHPGAGRWYRRSWASVVGVAAAVLLVVFGWLAVRQVVPVHSSATGVAAGKKSAPSEIMFVNHQPRIVARRLPDGTVVWLHPQAELRYPATFRADRRSVTFAGEAFFEVTKDARRPFLIQSGLMQIRVVGTSFNVRATPRQAIFEVAVVTGSVLVRSTRTGGQTLSARPVMLLPRQEVLYNVATDQLTRYSQSAEARRPIYEPVSAAFSDALMSEVIKQLETRFAVRIRAANPAMNACRLTADFTNQSLPEILELLCISLDATYTMAGGTVIIDSEGCS